MFDRDTGLCVRQGCWIECLSRMLDYVFERDPEYSVHINAGISVSRACWIEFLTGMLDVMLDRNEASIV